MPAITDLPIWYENGFEIRTQGTVSTTPATYTYNGSMQSYIFRNDGAGSITLTIGGNAVTVVSGEMVTGGALSQFIVQSSSGTASWTMRAFEMTAKTILQSGVDQATAVKSYTFQNATSTNQNGTPAFVDGYTTLIVQTTISGTITVNFEGSYDGITYSSIYGQPYSQGGNQTLSVSAAGTLLWAFNIAGLKYVQMRTSGASGSPSATVIGSAMQAPYQWKPATSNLGASDGQNAGLIIQPTGSYLFGFNGTSWDRMRTVNTGQVVTTWKNSTGTEPTVVSYNSLSPTNVTLSSNALATYNVPYYYNGGSYDMARNNISGTALASAARTGTTVSSDLVNYNHRGIVLILNVTVASGTGGLQVALQYKDPISAAYRSIGNLPTAVTTAVMTSITFYPSVDAASVAGIYNQQSILLPQQFRVSVIHGDSSSYTYSLSYQLIL